ncbi:hypothetical protein BHM03_00052639, partial [Ensete ventricosum]
LLETQREAVEKGEGREYGQMKRRLAEEEGDLGRKRPQVAAAEEGSGFFSSLSDDLVVAILCRLSASAARPSDLLGVLIA